MVLLKIHCFVIYQDALIRIIRKNGYLVVCLNATIKIIPEISYQVVCLNIVVRIMPKTFLGRMPE